MQYKFHFSPQLLSLLCKVNLARLGVDNQVNTFWVEGAEEALEAVFHCSRHLAVYGTLAPGELHEDKLSDLNGSWREALVRGDLYKEGWGASEGCPGLCWDPDGLKIPVKLLSARDMPEQWARLDRFEGDDYCRILVPIEDEEGLIAIANIYALKKLMLANTEKLRR